MAAVTVWLAVLFVVLVPKQSNEVSDQFSKMEFENLDLETCTNRIRELKQQNEIFYSKCKELREMREQLQATKSVHTKILELLITSDNTVCHILLDAAKSGDVNSAKLWVKYVNDSCVATDYRSYRALMLAAEYGHVDVVRVLLEGGANIEGTGGDGWNALIVAAINGKLDVCRLLLDRGAKVNAVDSDGYTALHHAAINGHLSVVKLLVKSGADVKVRDNDGYTVIKNAQFYGHTDVKHWLETVSQVQEA